MTGSKLGAIRETFASFLAYALVTAGLIGAPTPASAYNDGAGQEWRQPSGLLGVGRLTRAEIEAACPVDGVTPCRGLLAGVDMNDWVWATDAQVRALFGRYEPAFLDPAVSSLATAASTALMATFPPTFTTQVGGCGSYSGCWTVRFTTGITADLGLQGGLPVAQVGEVSDGAVYLGPRLNANPAGLWMWRPTGHGTGKVHAYDDSGRLAAPGAGVVVANVLSNDWVAGQRASTANVSLMQLASDLAGIWLDPATGAVHVDAGVAPGTRSLLYRICSLANPDHCDDATVTVVVPIFAITAANDAGTIGLVNGGVAIANVLANDRLGAGVATLALVQLSQVSTTHPNVGVDLGTGAVRVAPGTPHGTHAVVYRICDRALPTNCAQATATVTPVRILAYADSGRGSSKYANTPIASVLSNDLYGNARPTTSQVTLSTVGTWPAGIALNLTTGAVSVLHKIDSYTYTLRYRICEIGSTSNCSEATISLYTSGGG